MKNLNNSSNDSDKPIPTLRFYTIGFVASIIFTLIAYALVVGDSFSSLAVTVSILVLAVVQLFVQLYFFLHIGKESSPRWNLIALLFAGLVVIIVVVGSIWIMANLDYHTMPPAELDKSIIEDELIKE